jgi:ABC-2 type transport system ATP-binding protein
MRCELVAALLHRPRVLFLDEPTLGLDVTLQRRIRAFVSTYNQRFDATILLTSHYMADVTALCKRVVVIHRGQLLFDGDLSTLVKRYASHKTIVVTLATDMADLTSYGAVMSREDGRVTLRVSKRDTAQVTGRLLADLPVTDLVVEDPQIDDVIDHVFRGVML